MQYVTIGYQDPYLYDALTKLDKRVNEYLSDDWRPQGGVSIVKNKDNDAYYVIQAMIKE